MLRTIAVGILCLFLVGGTLFLVLQPEPAEASFTSEKLSALAKYAANDDTAWNLRLMAIHAMVHRRESGVETALANLASSSELKLAVAGTTALGKKKTTAAKTKLKGLVTSSKLGKDIRKSAMTAIAVHFRKSSDLTWLTLQTASDSDLKAHTKWLKTNIYGL
jgi:hypothetical protein